MNDSRGPSRTPAPRSDGFARTASLRHVIERGARARDLEEAQLVLRAVGIPHAVVREDGQHLLVVPAADGLRARDELAAYRSENRERGAEPGARLTLRSGWIGALVYAGLLTAVHLAAAHHALGRDWSERGMLDGAAVLAGQAQRVVTALTLHADAPHLAGNAVFGGLFGWALVQLLGNGVGWAAVLAGGAAGNALNVWLRAVPHRALGASTAVFAALGLLVMLAWHWRRRQRRSFLIRWAPVVVGLGTLGWLGTSGEHVDIPAHFFGFVAGLALGVPLRRVLVTGPPRPAVQALAGALALSTLVACWALALR